MVHHNTTRSAGGQKPEQSATLRAIVKRDLHFSPGFASAVSSWLAGG